MLDALTYAGNPANIADVPDVSLVEGDICDTALVSQLIADHDVDTIVHFAAESHVDRSITGPDAFVTTNVIGTHSLLKAAKAAWLDKGTGRPHRFHHVSTDEVYGTLELDDPAFSESTPYAPNSPYSASKAGSDHLVRAYALSGKNLPIYGDGMNIRDWLHVEDHCIGIELIMRKGRIGETYNVGGGQELPNIEVIKEICRGVDEAFARNPALASVFPDAPAAHGRPSAELMTYVQDRKGHDRRYAIDETKIRSELGYEPSRDFPQGFADTLNWFLDNQDWWRPLVARAALAG